MADSECPIPKTLVPITYMTDPETETVLFGDQLHEGMVIVAESFLFRNDPDKLEGASAIERVRIMRSARWSQIDTIRRQGDLLRFIVTYEDGSQASWDHSVHHAWIVKKASIQE